MGITKGDTPIPKTTSFAHSVSVYAQSGMWLYNIHREGASAMVLEGYASQRDKGRIIRELVVRRSNREHGKAIPHLYEAPPRAKSKCSTNRARGLELHVGWFVA